MASLKQIVISGMVYSVIERTVSGVARDFVEGLDKFVSDISERYEARYEDGTSEFIEPSGSDDDDGPAEPPEEKPPV